MAKCKLAVTEHSESKAEGGEWHFWSLISDLTAGSRRRTPPRVTAAFIDWGSSKECTNMQHSHNIGHTNSHGCNDDDVNSWFHNFSPSLQSTFSCFHINPQKQTLTDYWAQPVGTRALGLAWVAEEYTQPALFYNQIISQSCNLYPSTERELSTSVGSVCVGCFPGHRSHASVHTHAHKHSLLSLEVSAFTECTFTHNLGCIHAGERLQRPQ